MFPIAEIEKKIGYTFEDKALLQEAFTHASFVNRRGGKNNERLEYLGDSVLQLVVTEWQYKRDEQATEGVLTKRRQKIVCKDALDSAVDALGVYGYLRYEGKEENLKGKAKSSLFEAIVAAIYLDGGMAAAEQFIFRYANLKITDEIENPKGSLQEFLQAHGKPLPVYFNFEKSGADNAPVFRCEVTAMGERARGEGRTKKEAETTAAARLLWELQSKVKNQGKKK